MCEVLNIMPGMYKTVSNKWASWLWDRDLSRFRQNQDFPLESCKFFISFISFGFPVP